MSSQSKLRQILALTSFFLALSAVGCVQNPVRGLLARWQTPEAYVGAGNVAEVRRDVIVPVWVKDAKTGDMARSYVRVSPGWLVGPAATAKTSEVR